MKTQLTSIQTTITFDVYYNNEAHAFEAIYDTVYNKLISVDSLGYDWIDLPEAVMDQANEFSYNFKKKL